MNKLRSVGMLLIALAVLSAVVGTDFYYSNVAKAKLAAERMEGFELESVGIPIESKAAGLLGVVFVVAGIQCLLESRRQKNKKTGQRDLLE